MSVCEKVTALEDAHRGRAPEEEPSLWRAYDLLLEQWNAGVRDHEITLRLAFLAWYSWAEPAFLTGLREAPPSLVCDLFEALEPFDDEEARFALHVMIEVSGDLLSDQDLRLKDFVDRNQRRLDKRYCLTPALYSGRGAYGDYFFHQAQFQANYLAPGESTPTVTLVGEHDA